MGWLIFGTYVGGFVVALWPAYVKILDDPTGDYSDMGDHFIGVVVAGILCLFWPVVAAGAGAYLLSRRLWERLLGETADERERVR